MGVGWLCGVLIGSLWVAPETALTTAWIGSAAVYALSWMQKIPIKRARFLRLAALAILAGAFGVWRANDALLEDRAHRAQWGQLYGETRTMHGTVRDAEVRDAFLRLTLGNLTLEKGEALPGFLRTTVPKTPDLGEGARVELRGKVHAPEDIGQPVRSDLSRVFQRRQVFGTMRFPEVHTEAVAKPSALTRLRFTLRERLLQELPEPTAGLYSALLLSFDRDLPTSLRDAAADAGILHLVAISGSHIAAIAVVVFFGLIVVGLSRNAAMVATLAFTGAFLALVGFPESGVRSGIMAGLVFLAILLGRHAVGIRALLITAVVMTIVDPRILLGDIGFQLSALAVWGLLTLFPLLQHLFRNTPDPFRIRSLLLLTIAAELATLPVVIYTFGRIPLFGPIANLFAGVLFPFLLTFGALVLATSFLLPAATALVVPLATVTGNLFLQIAERTVAIPRHVIHVPPVALSIFLISLLLLIISVHALRWRFNISVTL